MLAGERPFEADQPMQIFINILNYRYFFLFFFSFFSPSLFPLTTSHSLYVVYPQFEECDTSVNHAWNLVQHLLTEPIHRLGQKGLRDFQCHPFFDLTPWASLRDPLSNPPPFTPELSSDWDTSYFEGVEEVWDEEEGEEGEEEERGDLVDGDGGLEMVVEREGPDLSFAINTERFVGFTFKRVRGEEGQGTQEGGEISMGVR